MAAPASAAAPPTITVQGEGRVSAAPDMATVALTLSTDASTAAAATSRNNEIYARLEHALRAMGIAQSDIRTSGYSLNYNPPPQPGTVRSPDQRYGYFVERSVSVTLHDTSRAGAAIDAAVAAGVANVNGVTFGVSDRNAQVAQALAAAARDARRKAEAMASAAGLHLTGVASMQEGYSSGPQPMMRMAASVPAPEMPTQIQPGSVEVTAIVSTTFYASP